MSWFPKRHRHTDGGGRKRKQAETPQVNKEQLEATVPPPSSTRQHNVLLTGDNYGARNPLDWETMPYSLQIKFPHWKDQNVPSPTIKHRVKVENNDIPSPPPKKTGTVPANMIPYIVMECDTLASIAVKFDTSTSDVARVNNKLLDSSCVIFPGELLYIPDSSVETVTVNDEKKKDKESIQINDKDNEEKDDKTYSENEQTKEEYDTEIINDSFLQLPAKFMSEQLCVHGTLFINPQSLMFRPNSDDPLVEDNGLASYEVLIPLCEIVYAYITTVYCHPTSISPSVSSPLPNVAHTSSSSLTQVLNDFSPFSEPSCHSEPSNDNKSAGNSIHIGTEPQNTLKLEDTQIDNSSNTQPQNDPSSIRHNQLQDYPNVFRPQEDHIECNMNRPDDYFKTTSSQDDSITVQPQDDLNTIRQQNDHSINQPQDDPGTNKLQDDSNTYQSLDLTQPHDDSNTNRPQNDTATNLPQNDPSTNRAQDNPGTNQPQDDSNTHQHQDELNTSDTQLQNDPNTNTNQPQEDINTSQPQDESDTKDNQLQDDSMTEDNHPHDFVMKLQDDRDIQSNVNTPGKLNGASKERVRSDTLNSLFQEREEDIDSEQAEDKFGDDPIPSNSLWNFLYVRVSQSSQQNELSPVIGIEIPVPRNKSSHSIDVQCVRTWFIFAFPTSRSDELFSFLFKNHPSSSSDANMASLTNIDSDSTHLTHGTKWEIVNLKGQYSDDSLQVSEKHFASSWEIFSVEDFQPLRIECMDVENSLPLPQLQDSSDFLTTKHIRKLTLNLVSAAVGYEWCLIYSTLKHGISLQTLYRNMANFGDTPTILLVRDEFGKIFGAMLSCSIKRSDRFYGTGESLLFSFDAEEEITVYPWTGINDYIIKGSPDNIAIGSGDGHFGLWLDEDFYHGSSHKCLTYDNGILSTEEDFIVNGVEAWGFQ